MILTGNEIKKQVYQKNIIITDFCNNKINTNSYDLSLGDSFLTYDDDALDPRVENKTTLRKIPPEGISLRKGDFILGHSNETIGSTKFVPIIHAKSGIARLGLFIHVTADLIDIGSFGQVTFQLYATKAIKLYSNMLIAQVSFWKPMGSIILYKGKYQNSKGPIASKIHTDFTINRKENEQ